MKRLARVPLILLATCAAASYAAPPEVVALPGRSPVVTLRIVIRTGAASDPASKPGTAALTAAMLAGGGTRQLAYKQIVETFYPMAAGVSSQVDKEMTVFAASTHVDNLEAFYPIFRAMLLDPGWRAEDLSRVRDNLINAIRVGLRGNNDEELGKEALYAEIYRGTPYGTLNQGSISALKALTLDDLKAFYRAHYTRGAVTIGIAGGYPPRFAERIRKDFAGLAAGKPAAIAVQGRPAAGNQLILVEKKTRSVAISIGFPLDVRRGQPDFPALLVAQSFLGQHRSGGRLYERMRQLRGLNYGDYAYIEYFPRGMFLFEPDPNLARQSQIFQLWIRPLEPPTAVFGLRLALFELDRLIRKGLTAEEFERTRNFLSKSVNLLMKTKRAELGYAIDSRYYGIPAYDRYLKDALAKLTLEDVNGAIRRHLHADNLYIVAVTDNAAALRDKLLGGEASPMTYNSPKPADILDEDKIVERWKLALDPKNVKIVPAEQLFE